MIIIWERRRMPQIVDRMHIGSPTSRGFSSSRGCAYHTTLAPILRALKPVARGRLVGGGSWREYDVPDDEYHALIKGAGL